MPFPVVPPAGGDDALRPFIEAVVHQVARGGGDAEEVWETLRWCAALAQAGDTTALADSLGADIQMLSACYQNADLLPVDRDDRAATLAQSILEATHRLSG
jgi:hypothetical protein